MEYYSYRESIRSLLLFFLSFVFILLVDIGDAANCTPNFTSRGLTKENKN
jgi:hypothetical protein